MSPSNIIFSVFSCLGFLACMIPLPWHLQAWNVGTCALMLWAGLACLNYFINAILWNDNFLNVAPIWCDISTRFIIALNIAIPLCSLCINRRLYHIATVERVNIVSKDRRREVIGDIFICLGIPLLHVALAIVYQGNRFNIYENYGCTPALYNTWVMLVLHNVPPILVGCVSFVYCTLSIIAFKAHQSAFTDIIQQTRAGLNRNRYFRLMAIAAADIAFTVPVCSWILYLNATSPLMPYTNWEVVHADFWFVYLIPASLWQNNYRVRVLFELARWLMPFTAFLFFALFGVTQQARSNYRQALSTIFGSVASRLRLSNSSSETTYTISSFSAGGSLLPRWRSQSQAPRKPSHISFDDVSMTCSPPLRPISMGVASFKDMYGTPSDRNQHRI
uniref:Putative pheromone receptor n=2 Tax=Flammulina TaxID=38944 RepID=M4MKQ3_FLAVE|nr:putative pheromone receptor [Flammulina velutipes]